MPQPKQLTFHDQRMQTGRGGPRPRSGRPAAPGARVLHREREKIPGSCPVHVTLRVRKDVPGLRRKALVREFRRSLAKACERGRFRVVHYSVQKNHVHMLVEAQGKKELASGMKSIGARFARAVNRVFRRRGPVLDGRFHHRILRSPTEVRNALAYVLLNVRKHRVQAGHGVPPVLLDDASSGQWFDGWKRPPPARSGATGLRDVAPARTWLLNMGWRGRGLIDPSEVPGLA